MKWYKRYAEWCRKRGTNYIIRDRQGNKPYLERFYLVPRWAFFGFGRIVIHRFWKSDDDGGLHDHPWPWASLVLEGGYYEYTPLEKNSWSKDGNRDTNIKWREPGDFSGWRKSTDLHRVKLKREGEEVWTMFFMGPRQRDWGFVPNEKGSSWIQWQKYLSNRTEKLS